MISFLKKRYPNSIFTATLGDKSKKRIVCDKKGYLSGSPNLMINNLPKDYTEFVIEFKNLKGIGVLIILRCCDSMKTLALKENYNAKTS